jgi:hypothetical protein
MNTSKILICMAIAAMALTACSVEDNPSSDPVFPTDSTAVANPFEQVSDQPAYAPGQ